VTHLAGRLRARLRDLHRHVGRGMKQALDESANPSCCVQDKIERVRSLVIAESDEAEPREAEPK
jgi:hypothetical protein